MKKSKILLSYILASLIMLVLAACSSLSIGTALKLQKLDVINDNVAQMVFAIETPDTIRPIVGKSGFLIDATTKELGGRNIEAILVNVEDFSKISSLPPLKKNRRYHLLEISEKGQTEIVDFQNWVKELKKQHAKLGGELSIGVKTEFCSEGATDISKERVSVFISLPDEAELSPLITNMKISEISKGKQKLEIPPCS